MKYRIKNWEKFQHFKDRKPIWIKLYSDLLDDVDYYKLPAESAKYLVLIWLIASEDKGKKGTLPDAETLAFRLRLSESKVNNILTDIKHYLLQDDIDLISSRYQDDALEKSREEKSREDILSDKSDEVLVEFEECWQLYPDKAGKTKALAAYRKARTGGVTQADVLAGLNRYLAYIRLRQSTDFADIKPKNGSTWFHQNCWQDEYTITASTPKVAEQWAGAL